MTRCSTTQDRGSLHEPTFSISILYFVLGSKVKLLIFLHSVSIYNRTAGVVTVTHLQFPGAAVPPFGYVHVQPPSRDEVRLSFSMTEVRFMSNTQLIYKLVSEDRGGARDPWRSSQSCLRSEGPPGPRRCTPEFLSSCSAVIHSAEVFEKFYMSIACRFVTVTRYFPSRSLAQQLAVAIILAI